MRLGVPISQNRKKDKRERHDFTVFVRGPVFYFVEVRMMSVIKLK